MKYAVKESALSAVIDAATGIRRVMEEAEARNLRAKLVYQYERLRKIYPVTGRVAESMEDENDFTFTPIYKGDKYDFQTKEEALEALDDMLRECVD